MVGWRRWNKLEHSQLKCVVNYTINLVVIVVILVEAMEDLWWRWTTKSPVWGALWTSKLGIYWINWIKCYWNNVALEDFSTRIIGWWSEVCVKERTNFVSFTPMQRLVELEKLGWFLHLGTFILDVHVKKSNLMFILLWWCHDVTSTPNLCEWVRIGGRRVQSDVLCKTWSNMYKTGF